MHNFTMELVPLINLISTNINLLSDILFIDSIEFFYLINHGDRQLSTLQIEGFVGI